MVAERQAWGRRIATLLEWVVLALMTSLALVVVAGVGFRKAGMALAWYDEIASILLAWLTFYGAALAALRRRHIGFSRMADRLPPAAGRVAWWGRKVAVIGFFALVALAGARVVRALTGTYLVGLPWVPVPLAQSVVPIGALLFIAAEILIALEESPAREQP